MSNAIIALPRSSVGRCQGCGMFLGPAEVILTRPDGFRAAMCPGCYQFGGIPNRAPFTWDGDRWVASSPIPTGGTLDRHPAS